MLSATGFQSLCSVIIHVLLLLHSNVNFWASNTPYFECQEHISRAFLSLSVVYHWFSATLCNYFVSLSLHSNVNFRASIVLILHTFECRQYTTARYSAHSCVHLTGTFKLLSPPLMCNLCVTKCA